MKIHIMLFVCMKIEIITCDCGFQKKKKKNTRDALIKFVEIKFNPPISTYLKQSRCVHSVKRSRLAELVFTFRAFDFTAIYGSDTVDYKFK